MIIRTALPLLAFLGLLTLTSCGSSDQLGTISGTVSVDGRPVESGTIHFRSTTASDSSGGANIVDGNFQAASRTGFASGEYEVVVHAFRKTGRVINDPQKGKVEEAASVTLADSPQTIAINHENAQAIVLSFSSAR